MEHKFLTPKFYEDAFNTLIVFNSLLNNECLTEVDAYGDGTYLSVNALETKGSLGDLAELISDMEAYQALNVKRGYAPMSLNALHEIHTKTFGGLDEIMWDKENENFELKGVLKSDEYS